MSILMHHCQNGTLEMVKLLVESDANVNDFHYECYPFKYATMSEETITALNYACGLDANFWTSNSPKKDIADYLLQHGAKFGNYMYENSLMNTFLNNLLPL